MNACDSSRVQSIGQRHRWL